MDERDFMLEALSEAKASAACGEVPVGAVIVRGGTVVGRGRNRRESERCAVAHAEVEAITVACALLGGWRLPGCTMYVTLEPCPMCAGAIVNARIERVVFGAYDKKTGSAQSVVNLFGLYPHKPHVTGGFMEEECTAVLTEFFKKLR